MIRYYYLDIDERRYYGSMRALLQARADRNASAEVHAVAQPPRDSVVIAGDPGTFAVQDGLNLHAALGGKNPAPAD